MDSITSKGGVIYRYKCGHPGCTMMYISETGKNFRESNREHLRAPSPIFDCANTTGHTITLNSFYIVDRESQCIARTIKEAIYIRVNNPSLNRNLGKYQLPHIWDGVLQGMLALCLHINVPITTKCGGTHLFHPLHSLTWANPLSIWGMHTSGKYGPSRGTSLSFPYWHQILPTIFWYQN